MGERKYGYDNLKAFLIICVVTGHMIQPFNTLTNNFSGIFLSIGTFQMPAFIFISGLFAKCAISDKRRFKDKIVFFFVLALLFEICIALTCCDCSWM